jgi:hypothetical protein
MEEMPGSNSTGIKAQLYSVDSEEQPAKAILLLPGHGSYTYQPAHSFSQDGSINSLEVHRWPLPFPDPLWDGAIDPAPVRIYKGMVQS